MTPLPNHSTRYELLFSARARRLWWWTAGAALGAIAVWFAEYSEVLI
jgi:hypothetical protein